MKYVGLDVGNGSICFVVRNDGGKIISDVYPSVYGVYQDLDSIAVGGATQKTVKNVFSLEDSRYVLGYRDVRAASSDPISAYDRDNRVDRKEFQDLTKLALIDAVTRDGSTGFVEVALCIGVPSEDFRKEIVDKIKEWFVTPIIGAKNGEQIVIRVKHIQVLSQPVAALVDQYLDSGGYVKNESIEDARSLVIDCGSGTMDLTELNGLTIVRQVSHPIGMNDVYRALIDALKKKNSKLRMSTMYDMEDQVRKQADSPKFVFSSGRFEVDLTEERQRIFKSVASRMIGSVMAEFPDRADFDHIYLAGGTGNAMAPYFLDAIEGLELCEDPQLAIARGLYKYVVSLTTEE